MDKKIKMFEISIDLLADYPFWYFYDRVRKIEIDL